MAADLVIHILEGLTGEELHEYQFGPSPYRSDLIAKVYATPRVWCGEVSWLSAAISQDTESNVPKPVELISSLVGFGRVIDDDLIEAIGQAFDAPNMTPYRLNDPEKIIGFLIEHKGKTCFQTNQ